MYLQQIRNATIFILWCKKFLICSTIIPFVVWGASVALIKIISVYIKLSLRASNPEGSPHSSVIFFCCSSYSRQYNTSSRLVLISGLCCSIQNYPLFMNIGIKWIVHNPLGKMCFTFCNRLNIRIIFGIYHHLIFC